MKPKKQRTRRSDKKIESREGRLLAYLRESRGLSMRRASALVCVSCATINHAENGRMDLTVSLILKLLDAYGYNYEEFQGMLKGDYMLPEHLRSECIEILKRLDEKKLKTVKAFLMTFLGN